jgi:hypothetical protein
MGFRVTWVRTGRRESSDSPERARPWSAAVRARRSASDSAETSGSMALMRATVSAYFFRAASPSSRPPPPNTPPSRPPSDARAMLLLLLCPCIVRPRRRGWNWTRPPPPPVLTGGGEGRVLADDDGWGQHSAAAAEAERAMAIAALLAAWAQWHLSGASCGGGALEHGDRPPRALGGGQATAEACGVAWLWKGRRRIRRRWSVFQI